MAHEQSMTAPASTDFVAPHPGSQAMPRWDTGELIDAPRFRWRNWAAMIGPGLVMGGSAIGGGEWLTGPLVTARYGGALLWLATLSVLGQVIYNIEISRYTLYSGEPIFTGKFRTLPGPRFWLITYIVLDFGSVFPYLAASAATPLAMLLLGHVPDITSTVPLFNVFDYGVTEKRLLEWLGYGVFLVALMPLVFGGKVYNSMKAVMTFKIAVVLGFLLFLAIFYSQPKTWVEILTGFVKFGNVPVSRGEDLNGNGQLDPGEDWDGDGRLDSVEQGGPTVDTNGDQKKDAWDDHDGDGRPERFEDLNLNGVLDPGEDWDGDQQLDFAGLRPPTIDLNDDGVPDAWTDANGDGEPDAFDDRDGDGIRDGDNVDNIFISLWQGRGFPTINLAMIGVLCAMIAISGNGGLSNTPISSYTRDQGWGMGHHVGAIPSVIGGHKLELSHVGMVFEPTPETLPRWRRWYRYVARDQLLMWMPACFVGLALPSMLSVQFLPRGTQADTWTAAGMTAGNAGEYVASLSGPMLGQFVWFMTLFCGCLVLIPSMASTADGVIRRWVEVFWTASATLRRMEPARIRNVFFTVLCGYAVFGLFVLAFVEPGFLIIIATMIYNYALGFSCLHTLYVNTVLLPRPLRPGWFVRIALTLSGLFFLSVAAMTTYSKLVE